jgi:hypothetical protein
VDAPAFELAPELADAGTTGIIYDKTDGLNFYNEYGMLRALFADRLSRPTSSTPTCCAGTSGRDDRALPFRRPPGPGRRGVRKVLREPNVTWAEHREGLMRRRKPWYYECEPRPDISVIGTRLSELVRR